MEFSAVGCNVLHEYAVGVNYNRLKIATDNVICVYVSESFLHPRSYFLAGFIRNVCHRTEVRMIFHPAVMFSAKLSLC